MLTSKKTAMVEVRSNVNIFETHGSYLRAVDGGPYPQDGQTVEPGMSLIHLIMSALAAYFCSIVVTSPNPSAEAPLMFHEGGWSLEEESWSS